MLLIMKCLGAGLPTRYGAEPLLGFRKKMERGGVIHNERIINMLVPFLPTEYGSNSLAAGVFTVPVWQSEV